MFREPLHGQPCALPVRRDQGHPMTGYRTVIDSFIALHEVPASALGDDRAYVLPAHTVTPDLAESTLRAVASTHHLALGPRQTRRYPWRRNSGVSRDALRQPLN